MENENRTVEDLLTEIARLQELFLHLSVRERENAEVHSSDSFLQGLELGFSSAYQFAYEHLDAVFRNAL